MAKQKIVMKVTMTNEKKTRKAFKIAAAVRGVDSVAFVGPDKEQIAVIGEGIDSVELTRSLRKRIGHTELVSVGKIEEKKPDKPVVPKETTKAQTPVPIDYHYPPHPYHVHLIPMQVIHEDPWSTCNIL
ncbi:hypothetical protein HanPSC8_Chr11g0457061 [Helianthus annuus]|uniref:HMA domain-containing protein n=1 Tax=Helianthus annuus TaxID=4232 RepID=A0A251T9Q1_HELAN|nr:hypothetical protein HanPSC8_Chr11g0457061 [Helianthus annuus]